MSICVTVSIRENNVLDFLNQYIAAASIYIDLNMSCFLIIRICKLLCLHNITIR